MNQLFSIFQFTESNPERIGNIHNDTPVHSHDYEELIIGVEGEAEHFVDYKTQKMTAPFISFVTRGKIHKMTPFAIDKNVEYEQCNSWQTHY